MTGPVEIMRSAAPPWQAASPWLWPRRYRPRGPWGLSPTATRGVPVRAFVMDVHASGVVTTHEVGRRWGGREYRAKSIVGGVGPGNLRGTQAALMDWIRERYGQQHPPWLTGGIGIGGLSPRGTLLVVGVRTEADRAKVPTMFYGVPVQTRVVGVIRAQTGAMPSTCAEESTAPCALTDADCVAMRGRGWIAAHYQCVQSWNADGTVPMMGPCDQCQTSATTAALATIAMYLSAAAVVGGIAHWGFGLAMVPTIAVGLAVPLVVTWAFMRAVGGTM